MHLALHFAEEGKKMDRKRQDDSKLHFILTQDIQPPSDNFSQPDRGSNIFKFGLSNGVVTNHSDKSKL